MTVKKETNITSAKPNMEYPSLNGMMEKQLRKYFSAHVDEMMPSNLYKNVIDEIEKTLINETLAATRGNQIKAAQILGINRNTLRKKILQHKGIKVRTRKH